MEFWLSEFNKSDKSYREEILKAAREGVAHFGVSLSHLLVNFLFIVSNGENQLMKNFQRLRALLEPRIGGGKLLVVDRVFTLLETGEKEVRDRLKFKKLKSKVDGKKQDQSKTPKEDLIFTYTMIIKFCRQIMFLEAILGMVLITPVWAEWLIKDFVLFEAELDAMEMKIRYHSMRLSFFKDTDRKHLEEKMNVKVQELWTRFELDH